LHQPSDAPKQRNPLLELQGKGRTAERLGISVGIAHYNAARKANGSEMKTSKREFLAALAVMMGTAPATLLFAEEAPLAEGNFNYIYSDPAIRAEFKNFLVNVFHLYPEDELHALILKAVQQGLSDGEIYRRVQQQLGDIKPFLGDLTYSLPTTQTLALLDPNKRYQGYLELGSNGRFLDSLEERLKIKGDRFTLAERAPTKSAIDIVDRGQIRNAGTFISLNDYRPALAQQVPPKSIDLVTVYIGFHHCPVELREPFLGSIREVLRPGGVLIVRDHNVHDERMLRMVSLAHDVFNMGTQETWKYNHAERRNFYSLAKLDNMLTSTGFKVHGRRLLQDGDPTLNTLMRYTRA
jgi:SAM-dependent methyltransferase